MTNSPLAARMASFKPSATATVAAEVNRLKAAGENIISLSIGVPNFQPPEFAYEAVRNFKEQGEPGLKYAPNNGSPELRQAFANVLERDGIAGYSANHMCAGAGGKNCLYNILLLLIDKGDKVLFPAPYWVSYPDMTELVNGTPITIDCPAAQDYKLKPEQLHAALKEHAPKLFIFNNPNNPSGMLYTRDEVAALAEVLKKFPDTWIVSDDIYDKLTYDGIGFHHLLHVAPELQPRTFIAQSISKNYGLPGWRVGITAAPTPELAKKLAGLVGQTIMNVPPLAMAVGESCFNGPLDFLEPIKADYVQKRDMVMKALGTIADINCPLPQGAFYVFPDVGAYLGGTHPEFGKIANDVDFCNGLLKVNKIAAIPGSSSGTPSAIRFSYATSTANLSQAMQGFADFCNEIKR